MITFKRGDLLQADVEALVNPVNTVGVMGKGLALQFKLAFPENFYAYEYEAKRGNILIGKMFVYQTGLESNPKYIINFPTKKHWIERSHLVYIESGLEDLVSIVSKNKIRSIALPLLGCGLGQLRWCDVCPLIAGIVNRMPYTLVAVYLPNW